MPHPIPMGWAGDESWGVGNSEMTFFFLYHQWQTPQTSKNQRRTPHVVSAGAPWPPTPPCLGWFPRLFYFLGDELQQLHEIWLEIWQGESLQGLFLSHKTSLSFKWVINWFLRTPLAFFPGVSLPWLPGHRWVLWNSKESRPWPWGPTSPKSLHLLPTFPNTPRCLHRGKFLYFLRKRRWASVQHQEKKTKGVGHEKSILF